MDTSWIGGQVKAGERFISVSASHSESEYSYRPDTIVKRTFMVLQIVFMLVATVPNLFGAELIDRIVAYVDDRAITYSEFKDRFEKLKKAIPGITENEAVNSMINNLLLLEQAHKMRLEAASDDDLVKEYIDVRIKSRVYIKEEQLVEYYNEHKKEFGGKEYLSVRDDIEKYLAEREINKQLKEHLKELRKQSNIVIRLETKD